MSNYESGSRQRSEKHRREVNQQQVTANRQQEAGLQQDGIREGRIATGTAPDTNEVGSEQVQGTEKATMNVNYRDITRTAPGGSVAVEARSSASAIQRSQSGNESDAIADRATQNSPGTITLESLTTEEFLSVVGTRVRRSRMNIGISRKQLAQNSGVSERYLAQLETGQGNISILLLRKVAVALDVRLEVLMADRDMTGRDMTRDITENRRNSSEEPLV